MRRRLSPKERLRGGLILKKVTKGFEMSLRIVDSSGIAEMGRRAVESAGFYNRKYEQVVPRQGRKQTRSRKKSSSAIMTMDEGASRMRREKRKIHESVEDCSTSLRKFADAQTITGLALSEVHCLRWKRGNSNEEGRENYMSEG